MSKKRGPIIKTDWVLQISIGPDQWDTVNASDGKELVLAWSYTYTQGGHKTRIIERKWRVVS